MSTLWISVRVSTTFFVSVYCSIIILQPQIRYQIGQCPFATVKIKKIFLFCRWFTVTDVCRQQKSTKNQSIQFNRISKLKTKPTDVNSARMLKKMRKPGLKDRRQAMREQRKNARNSNFHLITVIMPFFNFVLCFVSNNLQNYIVWMEVKLHTQKECNSNWTLPFCYTDAANFVNIFSYFRILSIFPLNLVFLHFFSMWVE